jgi:hypothetical protein
MVTVGSTYYLYKAWHVHFLKTMVNLAKKRLGNIISYSRFGVLCFVLDTSIDVGTSLEYV